MLENFGFFIGMVLMISVIAMVSDKIKIAYPILLVLTGLGISFIPSAPKVNINPHLIFMIFLPPLLYEAATVGSSWKEIWKWKQMIGSFAFLIVFLTSISIAFTVK